MRFGLYALTPQRAPPRSGRHPAAGATPQQAVPDDGQHPGDERDPRYVYAIDIRHV